MRLLTLVLALTVATTAFAQSILSRDEADLIFNLDRAGWEAYAKEIGVPRGWEIDLKPVETGTKLIAADRLRGIVLSMQPFYDNDKGPPDMLIVGTNYPRGTYPELTEERRQGLETDILEDLGSKYSALISFKDTGLMEGFNIIVTKE